MKTKQKTYYLYQAEPKDTSCEKYLVNHGRIFEEENLPLLPVHPNCMCKITKFEGVKINDSYINVIEYREFYANDHNLLPESRGRYYMRVYTNNSNTWIVYSNDGLVFYTLDNGKNFYLASVSENFVKMLDDVKLIYPSKDYESKYYEVIDKIPAHLYNRKWSVEDKIIAIIEEIKTVQIYEMRNWSFKDSLKHYYDKKVRKDYVTKEEYCKNWINAFREVIKRAAKICDIPPELLAGIAWIEVGGMFTFIDYVAYTLREDKLIQYIIDTMKFLNFPIDIKDSNLTSFGYLSMQLRRTAEVLRLNIKNMSEQNKLLLIGVSNLVPVQIFLVAQHLSD